MLSDVITEGNYENLKGRAEDRAKWMIWSRQRRKRTSMYLQRMQKTTRRGAAASRANVDHRALSTASKQFIKPILQRGANDLHAYGPADATATPNISCSSKIQNGLPFWCQLTQVVLEKDS